MEIRTKVINGNKWQFVNESWSTNNAWGHRTNVFKNGLEIEEHKSRYYNRTWESYTFQSCMFGAISEIEYKEKIRFVDNYKYENNIDRFKKGQKDEVLNMKIILIDLKKDKKMKFWQCLKKLKLQKN